MILNIIIAATLVILLTKLLQWYTKRKTFFKRISVFPGPKPYPFVGNGLDLMKTEKILPVLEKYMKENGTVFKVEILTSIYIFLADPQSIEIVLSSNELIDKSGEYRYFHSWLGNGLLTSTGSKWRKHRKIITPTFHFTILEKYIATFDKYSNVLVEKLKSEIGSTKTDVYPYITLYALDVIYDTAMGTVLNSQIDQNLEYPNAVREVASIMIKRSFSPHKQMDSIYRFTEDYSLEKKSLKIIKDTTDSVIEKRKKYMLDHLDEFKSKNDDSNPYERKKRVAFLDLLLQMNVKENHNLSDKDIKDEVATFMFEGHDTTASAISFTLYCLSKNQDVQQKLYEEIKSVFGDNPNHTTIYSDLQNLKYIELVIKESLRLYTTVPMFGRICTKDFQIDGKVIPKGCTIGIFAYGLHRNPDIWPDPKKFDPERFSPENQSKRSSFAYVPFSAGSRNCIGQKFAMFEMKCVISKILKNFKLLEVPDYEPCLSIESILKSTNGIYVQFIPR